MWASVPDRYMQLASSRFQVPPPVRHDPDMMWARAPCGTRGPLVTPSVSVRFSALATMSSYVICGGASMIHAMRVRWVPVGWNENVMRSQRKISSLLCDTVNVTGSIFRSDLGCRVTVPPSLSMKYRQHSFRRLRNWMCFSMRQSSSMSSSLRGSGINALSSLLLEKGSQNIGWVRPMEWNAMLSHVIGPMIPKRLEMSMSYSSNSFFASSMASTSSSPMVSRGLMCETLPLPLRPKKSETNSCFGTS
mmetsp:Transcript_105544/g.293888  ORF Transcript_105544/g.293888 Transcript_105544/m.293888 type:complete len:248 (+) Transcript_105544:2840-3583(+)